MNEPKQPTPLTWLWGTLTVLIGGTLITLFALPVNLFNAAVQWGNGAMRTLFDLVLGKGDLSALFSDELLSWLVLALGFILLTWAAWAVACHGQENRRYKALLPALYVGLLIAAVCTLIPTLFYGKPLDFGLFLKTAGGVALMVAVLLVYWFCWDRFPALVNAETVSYVVFGVLTTIVNLVSYNFCDDWLRLGTFWSTSIAWLVAVIFAYVVNKVFVFHSHVDSFGALCKEAFLFFFARFLTYFIDVGGMLLLVDCLHLGGGLSKILCNILVLILNYIFSKLFIFKDGQKNTEPDA